MKQYTERHCGVAVIKDKSELPAALETLAQVEEKQKQGCTGCIYEEFLKQLKPCRFCNRDKEDLYVAKTDKKD